MFTQVDTVWATTESGPGAIMNEYTTVENCMSYIQHKFDEQVSDRTLQRWAKDADMIDAIRIGQIYLLDYLTLYDFCVQVKGWKPIRPK